MGTWRGLLVLARAIAGEHEGVWREGKAAFGWRRFFSQQFFLAGCGEEEHDAEAVWCTEGLLPRAGGLSSGRAAEDICLIILSSF